MDLRSDILSPEWNRRVCEALEPGEILIWAAHPNVRAFRLSMRKELEAGLAFTGLFLAFLFATRYAMTHGGGRVETQMYYGCWVLVLIGIWASTAPLRAGRRAARIVYVVTNRRAVLFQRWTIDDAKTLTFLPHRLTNLMPKRRADGSGDLVFEYFTTGHGSGAQTRRRGFIGLADVDAVKSLIERTLLADRVRSTNAAN